MMFKMMILRRGKRKIMMLRTMMLRRTDPKTGTHTLCEPAQSKYTWTCHKSQKQFYAELYRHKAWDQEETKLARQTLCEPPRSKCTWTCDKNRFIRKFTSQKPQTKSKPNSDRTFSASLRSQNAHWHVTGAILEPLYMRLYKKKGENPDWAPRSNTNRPQLLP